MLEDMEKDLTRRELNEDTEDAERLNKKL